MKFTKFLSAIFGICGTVLLVGTLLLCLRSLDAPVVIQDDPVEAEQCTELLMHALTARDYSAASSCLYGQPSLTPGQSPEDPAAKLIYDAFQSSVSYQFAGGCYPRDAGFCRDVTVTVLDVAAVTGSMDAVAQQLLEQRIEEARTAGDPTLIYDEEDRLREDLIAELLLDAATRSLSGSQPTVTHNFTLELVRQEDGWWVLPQEALLSAITGGQA